MQSRVAVIGLGGMGSLTAAVLARRGVRVIGFDARRPPHDRGSTHGGSRVARTAYFEHADYVPLLREAFEGWQRLEHDTGLRCLHRCGVLLLGDPESEVIEASRASAAAHGIAVEDLDPAAVRARWPVFRLPEDIRGLLEPDAGFVVPEHGVAAGLDLAARAGADLRFDSPVTAIEGGVDGAVVRSGDEAITVDRVVVTAGAWTARLLPSLAARCALEPQRQVIVWCRPRSTHASMLTSGRMPAWLFDDGGVFGDGVYYAVPTWPGQVGPTGVKIGFHGPGPVVDPESMDRDVDPGEIARFRRDLATFLPDALEPPHASATCLYTMTNDRHFVIDRVPGADAIVVAAGFSGHGYKFAPVVAEILADLAIDGGTCRPTSFLELGTRPLTP